jgi:uncharacterized protein (TIGR02246 family)
MKLPNRIDAKPDSIPLLLTLNVKRETHAIHEQRRLFNEAIAAHDPRKVGACWLPDVQVSTSAGRPLVGREAVQRAFEQFFADDTFITFTRTPTQVSFSTDGTIAAETGEWVGLWRVKSAGEPHAQRGTYLGSWRKRGDVWLLQAELFVPLS